jgi:hypothetical protein
LLLSADSLVGGVLVDPCPDDLYQSNNIVIEVDYNEYEDSVVSPGNEQVLAEPILTITNVTEEPAQTELNDGDSQDDDNKLGGSNIICAELESSDYPSNSIGLSEEASAGVVDSASNNPFTEQLTETLLAANPPPWQEADVLSFVFEAQPGGNDFTLRLNHEDTAILEIVDNDSGHVQASRAIAEISSVTIFGSDAGDDMLTIDFSVPFRVEGGIEYHGGDGWFDSLVFVGNESLSLDYTAVGSDSGAMVISDGLCLTTVSFTGLEPVYISGVSEYTFHTSDAYGSGIDEIVIDVDPGGAGAPGDFTAANNRISGTTGGTSFESVTFYDVATFNLDTGANDTQGDDGDSVTIRPSGLIANGLENFTITTGDGADEVIVEADELALPVSGGELSFDGGAGTDTFMIANIGDTWNLIASYVGNLGGVDFSGFEGLGVETLAFGDFLAIYHAALTFQGGSGILTFSASGASLNLGGSLTCSITDDGDEPGDDADDMAFTGVYNTNTKALEFTADEFELQALDLIIAQASNVAVSYRPESVDVNVDGGDFDPVNEDDLDDASLLTIAVGNAGMLVGAEGVGFSVSGGQLVLARITPRQADIDAGDSRSFLALRAVLDNAALLGISGLTASAGVSVQINRASGSKGGTDAVALDWTTALDLDNDETFGEVEDSEPDGFYEVSEDLLDLGADLGLTEQELAIDFSGELLAVAGRLDLELFDFVRGNASFAFGTERIDVDLNGDESFDLLNAVLMTVALDDGNIFVGLDGDSDGTIGDGVGFEITVAQLAVAYIKPSQDDIDAGDGRSYLAIKAGLGVASLLGIDDIVVEADDLVLKINKAFGSKGTDEAVALNWTKAFNLNGNDTFGEPEDLLDPGQVLDPPADLALDFDGELLAVSSGFEKEHRSNNCNAHRPFNRAGRGADHWRKRFDGFCRGQWSGGSGRGDGCIVGRS